MSFNIPKKLKYRELAIKTSLHPLEIFERIERQYPACCFLESMEKKFQEARYSMIGFSPYLHLAVKDNILLIDGKEKKVKNPYDELKKLTKNLQQKLKNQKLPRGFCGGFIGYLSYEATKYFEPAFVGKKNKVFFDFEFGLYLDGLVFDNKLKKVKYFYLDEDRSDLVFNVLNGKDVAVQRLYDVKPLGDDIKKSEYKNLVTKAKEDIKNGEIFQLVISHQYKYKISGSLLQVYERVRKINPSPHMFFLRFADRYLIGSFPELVVHLENGIVRNFPIAGTRHRGRSAAEDKKIARGLLADKKERAEHMMLIDLGRNDIGRICEFDSVKVVKKMVIKKFSHVMHICSEIQGRILKNKDMFDALAVSMPMGTVSGAPKMRAMELINKYEKSPRGPYAGSIGYFSLNGDCKLTVGLRCFFVSKGIGSIRAAAGIVYDSKPEREFEETENKLKGMRRAVEK